MSETPAEVCLVRCPKCESLLPEVTDYSVYQCGGCGAILRASRKPIHSAKVSNEENDGVSNNKSKELQNVNFSSQKTKNLSLDFNQDDLRCNESMQIDQKMENLNINGESGNLEPQINTSRRPFQSSINQDEILRKLDELKDQIVQAKEKTSFSNNLIRSRPPIPSPYQHPYFSSQYVTKYSDTRMQFHHPLCSCLICYTNHHRPRPPPPLHYRHDYRKPYTQWSGNLHRPRRRILAAGGRRCRLVAGGSPFIACCNCFELLEIPTKSYGKTLKKLRCATCSQVILISVVDKKLVSNPEKIGGKINKENMHKWRVNTMEFSSNDFDVSGDFDFKWLDRSLSSPPSESSLEDHFDYSASVSRQSSMKDVATEIRISSNEYSVNNGTSQESLDQQDDTGGHESFLLGMIKKSFKLSRSNDHVDPGKVNVTVNGHPLPDRVVKKAEKISGPIQPGDYWYDSRAGFWGMMGGPCRGIIPPYIEEFNYMMPEKCADGHTGVFVNGRELHERDLDLLASRGLPTDRDRSYIIEISGRVFQEGSGSELQCLGKLAPTVENKKHGFGMKPPKMTD
ncbi:unnamed protein product [Lactuca saligna]|uniref:Zinc-ribbon domain-containing protein n=1 Tax=Lactuca saligna TaxID=75948 RepID=A0AA36ED65_LACSI|nr:unnamed protein product [Lactuca saligna]